MARPHLANQKPSVSMVFAYPQVYQHIVDKTDFACLEAASIAHLHSPIQVQGNAPHTSPERNETADRAGQWPHLSPHPVDRCVERLTAYLDPGEHNHCGSAPILHSLGPVPASSPKSPERQRVDHVDRASQWRSRRSRASPRSALRIPSTLGTRSFPRLDRRGFCARVRRGRCRDHRCPRRRQRGSRVTR